MTKQERLWRQGEAYLAGRQWTNAAETFRAIVEHDPSHIPALLHWSGAVRQAGQYSLSARLVMQAAALPLTHPAVVLELVRRLRELSEGQAIFDVLDASGFARQAPAPMLADVAMRIGTLGAHDRALQLAERAVALAPSDPQIQYLHASILVYFGRNDEARAALKNALKLAPNLAQAYWLQSRVRKASADDNAVSEIRRRLEQPGTPVPAQIHLAYALHNELHDLGEFDGAWEALQVACRAKRSSLQYDASQQRALIDLIRTTCDERFLGETADVSGDYTPAFVVGMYRSGTSLLERILGGHSAIADGGETHIFTAQIRRAIDHGCKGVIDVEAVRRLSTGQGFKDIGRGYLRASEWRARGRAVLTEKLPSNLLNAGFIAKALPQCRILHSVRDPIDTCFSNLRTFFTDVAPYSYDQVELADYFADSQQLANHWRGVLGDKWLDVSYDDLTQRPEEVAPSVFGFLGLDHEPSALDVSSPHGSVASASAVEVRQGILKDRGGAWRPYARHLGPMFDRLQARGVA